jgi:hypothetical protein
MVTMSVIFIVGGLAVVAAEYSGTAMTAAAEFMLAITVASALTLVTVGVVTISKRRRETRTENGNPHNPQSFHPDGLGNDSKWLWHSGQGAFSVRYCDKCGNRV